MPRSKAPLLFGATLFTSAALLFWIQPLIGKTLLPLLGGAPAVWNTCLLFFQTMLLAGYVYAVASAKWLSLRSQAALHIVLLLLIAIFLFRSPFHAPTADGLQQTNPTRWLLESLLFSVGPPFFILSASNPLLQSWFSKSRHHRAVDPYFLFAASNAGSLIALLAFPLVLEPTLRLNQQHTVWRFGFAVLLILTCVIAFALRPRSDISSEPQISANKIDWYRRLRWLALSSVPSSLMIGVTTYITADVAAVPLLWVIPLALYLLTFVLAFTKNQFASSALLNRLMMMAALVVTLIISSGATEPAWALILANLGFFFVAAWMCHRQLANHRPPIAYLPEYYLWIAVGGALGSVFNVLIAPVLFTSIVEYPLAIVLACMLRPETRDSAEAAPEVRGTPDNKHIPSPNRPASPSPRPLYLDVIYPVALYLVAVGLAILVHYVRSHSSIVNLFIVLGIPLIIINHFFRERPRRLALGLCAVMLAGVYYGRYTSRTVHVVRNFFGATRVMTDSTGRINSLYSGNTVHGRQFIDQSRACEPLSYHHENGPLGQVMAVFNAAPANPHVAVIGLGVGATLAYSKPGQEWAFYEINPAVINIARNAQHFNYLKSCANGPMKVIEGDARLKLQDAKDAQYGLIVVDAFSSDAIPVHLMTEQALDLYLSKLASGGILAFHISNRSLDLKPILSDLAESRNLICIGFDDLKPSAFEGKDPSQWVVMARSESEISNLSINSQWQRLKGKGSRVWSDDFSNIVRAIRWR